MSIKRIVNRNYLNQRNQINAYPTATIAMKEAVAEYLFWKKSYAPTAAIRYKDRLIPFISFVGKETHVSAVQTNDIIRYHQQMKVDRYSAKTIEYSSIIIKNFFMFWLGRGICSLNPIEIRAMKCVSPVKPVLTQEDFNQMNDCLDERFFSELTRKLVIHLLWDCGMRVSELCDIDIADIEDTRTPGIRCVQIRRRKSLKYNNVFWGPETNRLLNQYLGMRLSLNSQTDALLIASPKYRTRITTRTVQRWVKEITKIAMIGKDISPHDFRHSRAHRVLDKGENVRDVQFMLGHSNPASSFHYLSLNKERQLAVSEKYL